MRRVGVDFGGVGGLEARDVDVANVLKRFLLFDRVTERLLIRSLASSRVASISYRK